MEALKTLGLCVGSAVVYGIVHDNVTARVCVEYFTIGHPDLFGTTNPTLLAFGWGVVATWWMGVILGLPLVLVCRIGKRPRLSWRDLLRPIGRLLVVMAVLALVAGIVGYALERSAPAPSSLVGYFIPRVPPEARPGFLADWFAHEASYDVGFIGGLVIWAWSWRERGRRARSLLATGSS